MAPDRIGSYRVERLLGTGSFATVWLGHDAGLDARVAIKVLADNWSHDLRVRERFLDEGRLLWRLDHERVVRVHAFGELPDGRPYLVMALADGGSLRERIAAGPLPLGTGLRLLREIAAGVAVLHGQGIVHRDLTPGNVLFRANGGTERVVIADLGLAKSLAAASGLTARAGTPGYMAPEQDDPMAIVDARTDVYGLGRLGLALLGNRVPAQVAALLRTATARRPADRHPDAGAFGAALDRVVAGLRSRARGRGAPSTLAVAALAAIALVSSTTADSAAGWSVAGRRTAVDASGRISLVLPDGWRAWGSGWADRRTGDGTLAPAMVVAPALDRWHADPAMPGAFIGLLDGGDPRFLAGRYHLGCSVQPVRAARTGRTDWLIVAYTACRTGKPTIVEALGTGPAAAVYVQVAPPAGSGPEFVDGLLASVRVSAPRP